MKKVSYRVLLAIAFSVFALGTANAVPMTISTGDLGYNVVNNAGSYEVELEAITPSNSLLSNIEIKYGAWNSPDVLVSVLFNNTSLGSFLPNSGYISPGPLFITFDVTGLLMDGLNTIIFDGFAANNGDYVIGQVDLNYDNDAATVPEPGSLILVGLGLAGLGVLKRKNKGRADSQSPIA
jgi:hypothetical protein